MSLMELESVSANVGPAYTFSLCLSWTASYTVELLILPFTV